MSDPSQLTDAEKQAFSIYEIILTTSADRPYFGDTLEQLQREITKWKAQNPGLKAIEEAPFEVREAFLQHCFEWFQTASKEHAFRASSTLLDATVFVLNSLPRPLPNEIILRLLSELRKDAWVRCYFPFPQFLRALSRDQITEEMRADLRSMHLQYAPSPSGKIDEHAVAIRNVIGELIRVEGEKHLDPGRGPWSQIVFDEVSSKDAISRAGWEALLEHCRTLEQAVPSKKWKARSQELVAALGAKEALASLLRWLALGPTPGQPSEARSPIEDSSYQKGVIWIASLDSTDEAAKAIADFGLACLRKIRMLGAVSQKVGFASVQALGAMQSTQAIAELSRMRSKVKYTVARRLIEKSLHQAAERAGMTMEDLEDSCVESFPLDLNGRMEIRIDDAKAVLQLSEEGRVATAWYNADGKLLKTAPSHVRKVFGKEVKSVSAQAKDLERVYSTQRSRLESFLGSPREMSIDHWRKYFVEHPLLGFLGRRLIWVFRGSAGWEASGMLSCEGQALKSGVQSDMGVALDLSHAHTVTLWHPLSCDTAVLQRWRDCIFTLGIRQPFRQAFREFYAITTDEQKTPMYSNRFAGVIMRQHQLSSLCRARGWEYRLMSTGFDGMNVPSKALPQWNMHAEFYIDLPADRDPELRDSGLNEQSGSGINLFVTSDQVRFYLDRQEVPLDEVPAVVYSEVMRDVDLFTSVCAVGDDEKWTDSGDRGSGLIMQVGDLGLLIGLIEIRKSILTRILPLTAIGDRCRLEKSWLEVRGQLGTYQIQLGWGGAVLLATPHPRWLKIPQALMDAVKLDLTSFPIDLDYRTESVLRKAYVLADDWRIDSPELIRQLMPE